MSRIIQMSEFRERKRHSAGGNAVRDSASDRTRRDFADRAPALARWQNGPPIFAWARADLMLDAVIELLAHDPVESFMEPDPVLNIRMRTEHAVKRFLNAERIRRQQ